MTSRASGQAGAAQHTSRDTVYLDVLQQAAEQADRRVAGIELLNEQLALRLQTIRNERLPSLNGTASAQYFSDVASIGSVLGNSPPLMGLQIPSPYHDQYDASVNARTPLYDATRGKRVAVENAQTSESIARTRAAVWQQRQLVNDAFFSIQLLAAQQLSIDAAIVDLNARRTAAGQRVAAGSALPSELLLIDADVVRRTQSRNELQAQREATREVLGALVGREIPRGATLAV
ncbi:MAG: TolC family protein, partial [Gemmatimonas sp.]